MADLKSAEPVIMTETPITITTHTIQAPTGEPKLALTYNNIHIPTAINGERRHERHEDSCIDIIMCYFCCSSVQNTEGVNYNNECCSDCSCNCSKCDCDCDCVNDND